MISVLIPLLFVAQAVAPSLDQVRAEPNLERRARMAVEFAATTERNAEAAYSRDEIAAVADELKNMVTAMELAKASLDATGRPANRHPGPYKTVELRSQQILVRLGDLEKRMGADERDMVIAPRNRVQEIHDAWFDGIMGRKK